MCLSDLDYPQFNRDIPQRWIWYKKTFTIYIVSFTIQMLIIFNKPRVKRGGCTGQRWCHLQCSRASSDLSVHLQRHHHLHQHHYHQHHVHRHHPHHHHLHQNQYHQHDYHQHNMHRHHLHQKHLHQWLLNTEQNTVCCSLVCASYCAGLCHPPACICVLCILYCL